MTCEICNKLITDENHHSNEGGELHESCWKKYLRQSALEAGIPSSVIDGKTKLSDHFSKEYIDWKRGKS